MNQATIIKQILTEALGPSELVGIGSYVKVYATPSSQSSLFDVEIRDDYIYCWKSGKGFQEKFLLDDPQIFVKIKEFKEFMTREYANDRDVFPLELIS